MVFKLIISPLTKDVEQTDDGQSVCVDESSKSWRCISCGTTNVFEARYCANPNCSYDQLLEHLDWKSKLSK